MILEGKWIGTESVRVVINDSYRFIENIIRNQLYLDEVPA